MFRLRDLKNGFFQIHKQGGPAFEGTPRLLFDKAVMLGIKPQELAYAVQELQKKDDDYAEFGINGTFIFTKKDKK